MSDMLEQAIIDAEALREAATKNAETLILEKLMYKTFLSFYVILCKLMR